MNPMERSRAARLDGADAIFAGARAALVEDCARWTRALDDLETIWSLADLSAEVEEPLEDVARLVA